VRPRTSSALVLSAREGDRKALEELIRCNQERVARFVVSIVGRDADYEDLCQTVFVKMALGLPRLKTPETFDAWLFRIARNVCMDHLRRLGWRRMFVPFLREHEEVAARDDVGGYSIGAFEDALKSLPPEQREIIGLMRDGEWSYRDLARITGSSVSAVAMRLFRARARLRKILSESGT